TPAVGQGAAAAHAGGARPAARAAASQRMARARRAGRAARRWPDGRAGMEARGRSVRLWPGVLLALGVAGVSAHDTWFAISPERRLQLATGNRYPLQELNPGAG